MVVSVLVWVVEVDHISCRDLGFLRRLPFHQTVVFMVSE